VVTKLAKKNKFAKELFTKKFKPRIVKPKKGKGSYKRLRKMKKL
tara:strand:- start:424 stop:555 length:132 start_codon:yes stop_codon:yes gene_type:complete